jgi:hypothetical protein
MNTYNLIAPSKDKQNNTIKHILYNNKYDPSILDRFTKTKYKEKHNTNKWAKFTYIGKEAKFITTLFKDSSVKIPFTTKKQYQ